MIYLAILAIGLLVGIGWMRATKRARSEWLRQLNLVGRWERAPGSGNGVARSITFKGALARGEYLAKEGDAEERGTWRLQGHTLTLESEQGQPAAFDLRLFASGKIGLDGPGRERETYLRASDNVIRLRARR